MSDWQPWKNTTVGQRPGAKEGRCAVCGKRFEMDHNGWFATEIMVREKRVTWFRGDDEVQFAHSSCLEAALEFLGAGDRRTGGES